MLSGFLKIIKLANYRDLSNYEYDTLLKFLDPDEREKVKNKANKKNAWNSLLGIIMVRIELCKLTGMKNKELQFSYNQYHKPFLKNKNNVFYNISHTNNTIVTAFNDKPIGIDVETIMPLNYLIAKKVFSKKEQRKFDKLPSDKQQLFFYATWSMKEAYLKKIGIGLSQPMNSFDINSISRKEQFFNIPVNNQTICYVCTSHKKEPKHKLITLEYIFKKTHCNFNLN